MLSVLNEGGPGLDYELGSAADAFEMNADSLEEAGTQAWIDSSWNFSASEYHVGDAPYVDGKGFSP
jgi:hypothetical protein